MMKVKNILNIVINGEMHALNQSKILIGSAENCDLKVEHPSISHYHAMLFLSDDGHLQITDLQSKNGTYINGERISHGSLISDGDNISFGKLHCDIIASEQKAEILNQDSHIEEISELQSGKIYIPEQLNEDQVLIDDEYCDILFNDESFTPYSKNPLKGYQISQNDYIETEELEESFDILEEVDGNCIQITTTLSGHILEQYYYPIQDGTIHASREAKQGCVQIDTLPIGKPIPLCKIDGDNIKSFNLEHFELNKTELSISESSVVMYTRGPYQIFIEVSNVPNNLLHVSGLRRDHHFFKDTAKKFAGVLLPLLLILLVDFKPDKKPVKQLSIIYKKPTNANVDGKKMASKNPNDTKKNTGHKNKKQPDKKIAHSKAGKKAQPKKAQPNKIAKTAPAPSKTISKAKAKTKAYSFKMASNVNSVFSSSKTVAVTNTSKTNSVSTTSTVSGSLATKVNGTTSQEVGTLGSDAAGRAIASYGSKGLSSKSGRDTAYIQTETVVLGSMDPELLRKILQQYLPQFRHCYQQELAYNSEDIKGIVDLNFEITGSGKVSKINVKAKDSRFSKKGTNCMAKVLAIIDFPKPKGGGRVAVRQPLSFFSEQEKS